MLEHPTTDSESSSSPTLQQNNFLTPIVLDGGCGARSYLRKVADNRMPMLQDQIADLATGNNLPVSDIIASDYARLRDEMPEHDVLLRTPSVVDSTGGAISETQARQRNRMVKVADQVAEVAFDNGLKVSDAIAASLLPTPSVGHIRNHDEPIEDYVARRQKMIDGLYKGMPGVSLGVAETTTNWGKFAPAIERWESLTRVAPAPTQPDGQDGNHRLSAEFTEWMMGLPEGWVTAEDIGLKRNDQLKACGNGVVPQQAELALRILLKDVKI
jgi:hypothetical protein